jgi:hypothetical protein
MTPEELDRKIEFIVESQARLAAAQEQDREDRIKFEEWSKNLDAKVIALTEHQSRRMDRLDKIYDNWLKKNADFHQRQLDFQDESRAFQREAIDLLKQARHLLNLMLDRLPPTPPSAN